MDSPSLKDTKEGASATVAGREFHKGTVRGKKLDLKHSVEGENRLNFLVCDDLVLAVDAHLRKTMIYNNKVDLNNHNVYTKFGFNQSIRFQDIEQKLNSDVNQGP